MESLSQAPVEVKMRVMELARKYGLKPVGAEDNGSLCPKCGCRLVVIGGCETCYECGWSRC